MTMPELPVVYIGGADSGFGDVHMWAVDGRNGEVFCQHVCSSRSWGKHDLHDVRLPLYLKRFGGIGNGEHYRIVEVHTWSDVPEDVRAMNAAGSEDPAAVASLADTTTPTEETR